MTAFTRQDWPATSNACSVKSTAVIFLSVAIVVVTTPARALWQIIFEHAINDFDGIANDRIVRVANTESHQMQEISADHIPCCMQAAAVGKLNHRCIWIGVWIRRIRVRGVDPDVVARKSIDQFTLRCNRPLFNVRSQPEEWTVTTQGEL